MSDELIRDTVFLTQDTTPTIAASGFDLLTLNCRICARHFYSPAQIGAEL